MLPTITLPGSGAPAAQDAHRWAGTLCETDFAEVAGQWQVSLRLEDRAGRSLYVYHGLGQGEAGAMALGLLAATLHVGQRYHGTASLHRRGDLHDYYTGRVTLAADNRRPHLQLVGTTKDTACTGS